MSPAKSGVYLKVQKSPRNAAMASLVVPGAGQIYNRELAKGCVLFLLAAGFMFWTLCNLHTREMVHLRAMERTGSTVKAQEQGKVAVPWPLAPLFCYGLVALYSSWDGYRVTRRILDMVEVRRNVAAPTKSFRIPDDLNGAAIPRRRRDD